MLTDNLGRLYMPESNLLWMEVIQKHHNSSVARHPGYEKTLDLLQHNYYWPRMATTVKEYVARCDTCQRFKGSNTAPAGLLHLLETLSLPWEHISANFITDLHLSHSLDVILMVIDQFSKEVELNPLHKNMFGPGYSQVIYAQCVEASWTPTFHYFRLRPTICCTIHAGNKQSPQHFY